MEPVHAVEPTETEDSGSIVETAADAVSDVLRAQDNMTRFLVGAVHLGRFSKVMAKRRKQARKVSPAASPRRGQSPAGSPRQGQSPAGSPRHSQPGVTYRNIPLPTPGATNSQPGMTPTSFGTNSQPGATPVQHSNDASLDNVNGVGILKDFLLKLVTGQLFVNVWQSAQPYLPYFQTFCSAILYTVIACCCLYLSLQIVVRMFQVGKNICKYFIRMFLAKKEATKPTPKQLTDDVIVYPISVKNAKSKQDAIDELFKL